MSRLVVDASVVIKWFVPEVHSEAAVRFLDGTRELLAPDLLVAESGNILWKKVCLKEITQKEARQIVRALTKTPIVLHPTSEFVELALEIALQIGRTVYDSLYLALAVLHRCRLVTADRKFHDAVSRGSFRRNVGWVEDQV